MIQMLMFLPSFRLHSACSGLKTLQSLLGLPLMFIFYNSKYMTLYIIINVPQWTHCEVV